MPINPGRGFSRPLPVSAINPGITGTGVGEFTRGGWAVFRNRDLRPDDDRSPGAAQARCEGTDGRQISPADGFRVAQ